MTSQGRDPYGIEVPMPKISSKRQITLPIDLCILAGINPGDEVSTFVDRQGIISIVKKNAGSAKGILKGIHTVKRLSDEASLTSAIQYKYVKDKTE